MIEQTQPRVALDRSPASSRSSQKSEKDARGSPASSRSSQKSDREYARGKSPGSANRPPSKAKVSYQAAAPNPTVKPAFNKARTMPASSMAMMIADEKTEWTKDSTAGREASRSPASSREGTSVRQSKFSGLPKEVSKSHSLSSKELKARSHAWNAAAIAHGESSSARLPLATKFGAALIKRSDLIGGGSLAGVFAAWDSNAAREALERAPFSHAFAGAHSRLLRALLAASSSPQAPPTEILARRNRVRLPAAAQPTRAGNLQARFGGRLASRCCRAQPARASTRHSCCSDAIRATAIPSLPAAGSI